MTDELLSQEAMDDLLKQGNESAEKAEKAKKKADAQAQTDEEEASAQPAETPADPAAENPDIRLYPGADQVRPVQFSQLTGSSAQGTHNPLDLILDVELHVTVELGRTSMQVRDILELGPGSVVELQKLAGEPVDLIVNNKLIARGEVVVIDENFGVRVTEIVSQAERVSTLR